MVCLEKTQNDLRKCPCILIRVAIVDHSQGFFFCLFKNTTKNLDPSEEGLRFLGYKTRERFSLSAE